MVFVGTARKGQDTSTRTVQYTKPSKLDLCLGLERNVAHVVRINTQMLTVRKISLIKILNGTKILVKRETAGSSVEVVLATVDEPDANEQDFHGVCL